ncbi:SprT-like domain-containing protein [Massilia sp. CCM 9210]|uniref:SprT-like domain-containing protein n=1 Tax=Massilia scottii TaxID=3057166 RepID=UPI00279652AD|nr:SprT-like domain-containing protein [Massilia sp. CCM 9210]MDQ1817282.1 SprT-like domain-containing protein [Massilia sp. CCM 9210]
MPDISSHEPQTALRQHEHPRPLDAGPLHGGSVSPARAPGHAPGWKSEVRQTAIVYAELQLAYDTFNAELFDNSLADCLLTLQRKDRTMGYFSAGRFGNRSKEKLHEIAMNPAYFAVVPLVEIMGTMVHEMCHLWQHQHGIPARRRYHDKEWGDKMEAIGLMPSATGLPGGKKTGDKMADYPIEGGRFLEVCRGLLTRDFQISWYDRFVAYHPGGSATGAAAPGMLAGLPPEGAAIAAVSGVDLAPPALSTTTGSAANKSNRSKYSCSCPIKASVWGKPGLNIFCGDCGATFLEEP